MSDKEAIKGFKDLFLEVQEKGLCGRCGGCVSFCSAGEFNALKISDDGSPEFIDEENGIWISVRFTGPKSYKKVYDACQEFVDSTFAEDDDDESECGSMDGEADDPEDGGDGDDDGSGW